MKGVVKVNIAGIAFRLDDQAYIRLEEYLNRIRNCYGDSPEGKEILGDIEARIAEIILTNQESDQIVSLPLVDCVLERLGAPEVISDGADSGKTAAKSDPAPEQNGAEMIPHRLYRNPDGAKLGGVCSGLAAYFNTDPAWVRLIFAAPLTLMIFFYVGGWERMGSMMAGLMTTSFILYFLLWIVIPKAKTPLQRLEMRGEKITRDKLEKSFREEFQSRSNDPANIQMRARNERSASVFSEFVSIIGKILLFGAKALVAIIGFGLAMAVVAILVAIVFILAGGEGTIFHGIHAPSPTLLAVFLCLAILIPLGLAVYGILKMLFHFDHSKSFVSILLTIWVLTLVFGTVIFIKDFDRIDFGRDFSIGWSSDGNYPDYRVYKRTSVHREQQDNSQWHRFEEAFTMSGNTLFVEPMDSLFSADRFMVKIHRESPKYDVPTLVIKKTHDGYKPTGSQEYIDRIRVDYILRNDTLYLKPTVPDIPRVDGERAEVNIYLPAQKTALVGKGIDHNEYFEKK